MKIVQDRYSQIPLVIFAGTPGSGTKKQDMVDSEDQSFSKRGAFNGDDNPSLHSLKDAKLWSAMVMPQWQAVVSLPCLWTSESREPDPHAYPEARRQEILHAYQERSSLRGLTRTFGVSRTTVSNWIKKKELSFLP